MTVRRVPDLRAVILGAWRTNALITERFVSALPDALLDSAIPGAPRRRIRMVVGHLHNARCMWIKTLGKPHGVVVPRAVDRRLVSRRDLLPALRKSAMGIEQLLELGNESGGAIPPTKSYAWRNLPLDVGHVLAYFVAHEAHHRGQIVVVAREIGHRLPPSVVNGLWQWSAAAKGRKQKKGVG
jgi:uncharacterized damage-inducible protein DinB